MPDEMLGFLDYRKFKPSSAFDLPDLDKGVQRVLDAIQKKERIGVWGDFDVDGQTSTAVLVSTLRQMSAETFYHVPIRNIESHGIQLTALKEFLKLGIKVIITCDTGISANESIAYAQMNGIDVIVTDHHTLPDVLPSAYACINPHQLAATHPMHSLPGVGVAFKFAEALLSGTKQFDQYPLNDLAALGIIADLAELRGDARFLVQSGLAQIRQSPRPSLRAMLEASEVNYNQVTEEHISFNLAPRLNAIGRLSDANPMVEFLLSEDPAFISVTVNQLEGLNDQRKILCDQVFQGAIAQIERNPALLDDPVLILTHPEWPAGVIGIVASRLTAIYHRPVILLVAPENELMRGSTRSVEGVDITAAITRHKQLLTSFGGHPMAAGLALDPKHFREFQRGLNRSVAQMQIDYPLTDVLEIDALRNPSQVDFEMVSEIELLAPFGPGNPALVFGASQMRLLDAIPVGKAREHLQMTVEDAEGVSSKLIWWQGAGLPQPDGIFDLAYSARSSNYRGEQQIQLEWVGFQQIEPQVPIELKNGKSFENIDFRANQTPEEMLKQVLSGGECQVWKEGSDNFPLEGLDRINIQPAKKLIIWTIPSTQEILENVIYKVKPKQIYWFGIMPLESDSGVFIRAIAMIIKSNLVNHQDRFSIEELSAAAAMPGFVIIQTIHYLAARGDISIINSDNNSFTLSPGGVRNDTLANDSKTRLSKTLKEIQSFRKYYLRVDLNLLTQNSKKLLV
jgi:single-stranded-DNA-specific exonuclease